MPRRSQRQARRPTPAAPTAAAASLPRPTVRLRRLRATAAWRDLVRETTLRPTDLILPLFVSATADRVTASDGLPDLRRLPVAEVGRAAAAAAAAGIRAVLLFGLPRTKDPLGREAWSPRGAVQRAVAAIKREVPGLAVITDVCLCGYTDHGHCGVVLAAGRGRREPEIANDPSLGLLARIALSHAAAGADAVAPSDMMDGRVGAIRHALDRAGHPGTLILSYAAKYCSAFYGPFRDAAASAPACGDRRTYQMDPANAREALREIALDIDEGADLVMVKPGLAYLDIVRQARDRFAVPLAVYNVSGEYAMVKAAAAAGWLDERAAVMEQMLACKRAGADLIVTYWACHVAGWLAE